MRTYEEALAAARDGNPFSNGTEGYAWMGNWCDRCAHDAPFQRGQRSDGCPLLLVALSDKTPVEWLDQTEHGHRLGDTYHCTRFAPDDGGDGGGSDPDPGPPPEVPGQLDLFTAAMLDGIETELGREGRAVCSNRPMVAAQAAGPGGGC